MQTLLSNNSGALANIPFDAAKIGLLPSLVHAEILQSFLRQQKKPVILDTVLGSTSGYRFVDDELLQFIQECLFPLATIITPNLEELERFTQQRIDTADEIVAAAKRLLEYGASAVLIKGGHWQSSINQCYAQDYFTDGQRAFWLSSLKNNGQICRGTGCALSSAIASGMALQYTLYDAIVIGKMAINQGYRQAYAVGTQKGVQTMANYGPLNITHFPDTQQDLPYLTRDAILPERMSFAQCNQPSLGLYPIVDRAHWIPMLVNAGVTTVQLRVKDLQGQALNNEVKEAIRLSKIHPCRLFINDYWQLAISLGAYGVHLGQEDLDEASVQQIGAAGLRLGISTHCHYEVARAHCYQPSYIAFGPVYHTNTKVMPWVPQGVIGLAYWRKVLQYPLVAIGGIHQERMIPVAQTGVDGIAMITAVTEADNPEQATHDFVQLLAEINA